MYVAGTMFFLLPGMVTGLNILAPVSERAGDVALMAVVVSLAGFLLGHRRVGPSVARSDRLADPAIRIPVSALVALVAVSLIIKLFLDVDTIVGRVLTGLQRPESIAGKYLAVLTSLPTALGCLAPWLWRTTARQAYLARALIAALALIALVSLSRTPVFYVLGSFALYWLWTRQATWSRARSRVAIIGLFVALTPVAIFLAALIKGTNASVESALRGRGLDFGRAYEFAVEWQMRGAISDAYGNLLFVVDNYPSVYGYMPWLSTTVLLTAPIPRSAFPWKPWSPSYHVTSQILGAGTFEVKGTSLAPSTIGELWMNGGVLAVFVGSFLLGVLAAWLRARYGEHARYTYRTVAFHMALLMYFLIPRGDLLSTFVRGATYVGFAVVTGRALTQLYTAKQRALTSTNAFRRDPTRVPAL
jgi:hypothetical protein